MSAAICLKRILFPFVFSLLMLLSTSAVLAQESTPSSATATTRRETVQQKVDSRRELVQAQVEMRKTTVQERIMLNREKLASKEATLKLRLDKFRNQEKATIAAKVSINLNKINEKMTLEMSNFLERISSLLAKLEARVNQGTPDIKDPTAAKVAIASASASIKTAQDAVDLQAEKDYTITVSTEARIRTDVTNMRRQLHTDLQALRKLVIDAKQAVGNAVRVAKSGVKLEEATSSGQ